MRIITETLILFAIFMTLAYGLMFPKDVSFTSFVVNVVTPVPPDEGCLMEMEDGDSKVVAKWQEKHIHFQVYNFPKENIKSINDAIDFWEQNYPGIKITYSIMKGLPHEYSWGNKIIWNSTVKFGENEQAKTTVNFRHDKSYVIVENAIIKINSKKMAISSKLRPGYIYLQSLMIHEMGHALGLGHDTNGVMEPVLPNNYVRNRLSLEEMRGIQCILAINDKRGVETLSSNR